MKTVQEFYKEVMANEELKEQFIEAAKAGRQEEFLKEHGCDATAAEVSAFLDAKANEDAPLSFDELENAAGGKCTQSDLEDIGLSIGTFGVGCATKAIDSAVQGVVGYSSENDSRLCAK